MTRPRKISYPTRCVGASFDHSCSPQVGGVVATAVGVGEVWAISELVPQAVHAIRTIRASARAGIVIRTSTVSPGYLDISVID